MNELPIPDCKNCRTDLTL